MLLSPPSCLLPVPAPPCLPEPPCCALCVCVGGGMLCPLPHSHPCRCSDLWVPGGCGGCPVLSAGMQEAHCCVQNPPPEILSRLLLMENGISGNRGLSTGFAATNSGEWAERISVLPDAKYSLSE